MRRAEVARHQRPRALLAFITGALLIGVAALVLSVVNQLGLQDEQRNDTRERVAADFAGCERGNVLRGQTVRIGEAGERLVIDVVEALLSLRGEPDPERAAAVHDAIAPALERHAAEVAAIELVDCGELIRPNDEGNADG